MAVHRDFWSNPLLPLALATFFLSAASTIAADAFPDISELPVYRELPDPLMMFSGQRVTSKEQWFNERRPELKALFQHYMYGYMPAAPRPVTASDQRVKLDYFGGKAEKREVEIAIGPPGTPRIHLLVVIPKGLKKPAPVFVGMNFCGNHTLVSDPDVALPESWLPSRCPGCVDNRATDAARGAQLDVWNLEYVVSRGYAVATFYSGDIDPDKPDFTDGVHPHYLKPGQTEPGPHDWGTIAAWAWGISRVVDYLVGDPDTFDPKRIAVVGHSRLGKTALLAAAFDERIALAIPHQAGCGGTAPSRGTVGESVRKINDSFPHWFNDVFPKFGDQVERLPFDQHCLVALVAPRPVLFTNATENTWANPDRQFQVLQAADPVYRFLGAGGLEAKEVPPTGKLVNSNLGYFIREGKHSMTKADWDVFLEFADKHLK